MADANEQAETQVEAEGADAQQESPKSDYWKSEAHKAFAERKALKEKLRAFEEREQAESKKRLEETQAYKQELEKIMPDYENLKKFRSEYDSRLQAKLEESEKALPQEHRGEYDKFISKLDTESKIEWLSNRLQAPKTVPSSPATSRTGEGKATPPVKDLPFEERVKLATSDPEAFKKLL